MTKGAAVNAVDKAVTAEARARASRIRAGIASYLSTLADVAKAYQERDWVTLGYASWKEYIDTEFSELRLKLPPEQRQKAVAELRLEGLSQRAIGTALKMSTNTVQKDLSQVSQTETPDVIAGHDGKTYTARNDVPARPPTPIGDASPSTVPDIPTPTGGEDSRVDTPARESTDRVREFVDADPNVALTAWRAQFMKSIHGAYKLLTFDVSDVADKADEDLVTELDRLVNELGGYAKRVKAKRPKGLRLLNGGAA